MSSFQYAVDVFAPFERVWTVLVDVERWPQWTPTVTRVERLESGALAIGSRTKIWQPGLMANTWRVTALDEGIGVFTWETSRPGIKIVATHRASVTPEGVRVTLALDYKGLLGALMAWQLKDLNWDYLTKEGQGLKARCEQQSS
jgi:uncharacterized membrane protein